jgi:hypothetical protein
MTTLARIPFKGSRSYLQGPDLLEALLDMAESEGDVGSIRFAAHGFIKQNAVELESRPGRAEPPASEWPARLQAEVSGNWRTYLARPAAAPSAERLEKPFDEESLWARCTIEGFRIFLAGQSSFAPIETLVSMKKRLMQTLFPQIDRRWIFVRAQLSGRVPVGTAFEVDSRTRTPGRLFVSDIAVDGRSCGELHFMPGPK